jgi:hypothetical protein
VAKAASVQVNNGRIHLSDTDLQVAEDNQEPERPDWLPENFETPEALAKSYKEAQRKISEESQSRKALEQQVSQYEAMLAQANERPQQQYDPNADPFVAAYETAMENGDYRSALALHAQIAEAQASKVLQQYAPQFEKQQANLQTSQAGIAADYAWQSLEAKYPNLNEHREQIVEAIQDNPNLIPAERSTDPQYLAKTIEFVYRAVNPAAFVQGHSVDMTSAKTAAQTLPGAAGRPPAADNGEEEWKRVMAAAKTAPGEYWR